MTVSDDSSLPHPADPGRRDFLRAGAAAAGIGALAELGMPGPLAAAAAGPDPFLVAPPMERVRIGFVGVGGMGMVHVENLLHIPGAEIRAVCDVVEGKVVQAQERIVKAGFPKPAGFSRGPRDFERMCQEEDLDLVYTATPWEWHVPVCVAAMRAGKHAVTEVPAAYTVDDCWRLVETAEKERKHCIMMENCNYGRSEMLVLNMARKGMFGELLHGEAGYLHDLRSIKFSTEGEGLWRRAHAMRRNGNLYPTHGLGPIAQCMDVNRGDRFDHLVSMSSNSRGLQLYAAEHFPAGDPRRDERFKLGDVNVTLIRTVNGRTIYLAHNCDNPRPYSRINLLQGTRGIFSGYPDRVHIEGRSKGHGWETLEAYYDEFEHPLWKSEEIRNETTGHGGMDFLEDRRLIDCLRAGTATDMNVYDAAALSVITPLTERSVASRSRSMDVPDFTRGRWKTTPPLPIVEA
jgi:predicted dehydrogenase